MIYTFLYSQTELAHCFYYIVGVCFCFQSFQLYFPPSVPPKYSVCHSILKSVSAMMSLPWYAFHCIFLISESLHINSYSSWADPMWLTGHYNPRTVQQTNRYTCKISKFVIQQRKHFINFFPTRCNHSRNGCCLPLQRVASLLTTTVARSNYSCDGVLKLTEIAISHIHTNKSHLVLQICNMFLRWISKNKLTNPRFCLAACWNAWNSFLWWRNSGLSFQALKLILQPGSDDELPVDHYESSNESVEDEDFAEDGPKIIGNPEYETDKESELNDKPGTNDVGEENFW